MSYHIEINPSETLSPEDDDVPEPGEIKHWLVTALKELGIDSAEVSVAVLDKDTIRTLNKEFRGKDKATNVLSFPAEPLPDAVGYSTVTAAQNMNNETEEEFGLTSRHFLGDILCCPQIIRQEAEEYGQNLTQRWAHMLVHGLLHLHGMDHETDAQRDSMESAEISILNKLGFANPYIIE